MYFSSLAPIEQIYWIIAVAASSVLAVQLIIACFSGFEIHLGSLGSDLGGHDTDIGHHDVGMPHFQLLTIRNIVAFFTLFGWSGLAFYHQNMGPSLVIFLSFICGVLMMFATAGCFYGLSKLQSEGTLDFNHAKGLEGSVYLRIPPVGFGQGQIKVSLQGRLVEMEAFNTGVSEIPTGATVLIKEVSNLKAIVERVN
jgi:hypothetical protein